MRLLSVATIAVLFQLLILGNIAAQETTQYVNGVEGIKAATLPPPGVYYRLYGVFYTADELMDEHGDEVHVPDEETVARFAGTAALQEPAAAVIGAFCAVEHLKGVLGLDAPRDFPSDLWLSKEG